MSNHKTKKSLMNKEMLLKSQVDDLELRNSNLLLSNVERSQENENLKNEVSTLKQDLERANRSNCNSRKNLYVDNNTYSTVNVYVKYKKYNGEWSDWIYWEIREYTETQLLGLYNAELKVNSYKYYLETEYGGYLKYSNSNPKLTNICKQRTITINN